MVNRRLETAARLLPLAGAILFLPPIALLFDKPVRVFGIPLSVLYLLGVWLALILVTLVLGHFLRDTEPSQAQSGSSDTGTEPQ